MWIRSREVDDPSQQFVSLRLASARRLGASVE
jgi:hypothetical protein